MDIGCFRIIENGRITVDTVDQRKWRFINNVRIKVDIEWSIRNIPI